MTAPALPILASPVRPSGPTVLQWVVRLAGQIEQQKRYAEPFEVRYRNQYVLPFIVKEYRDVYGSAVDTLTPALHPPLTGSAAIGIDALVERLTVIGCESEDAKAAKLVEQAWEDCDLDVMHREAHREAFIKSRAFAQVSRSTDGRAIVGIESPEQMAVHREQSPPYDVVAALKVWVDEWTGRRRAKLDLPGRDIRLVEDDAARQDPEGSEIVTRWRAVSETATKLPGVAAVEFAYRPRLLAAPISEIEPIASLVDIADLIEGVMVFAGHFGAVPIRWAKGLPVARDPKDPTGQTPLVGPDGKPVIGFNPRADHLWTSTSKDTEFGQLEPAGLASFVTWAEHVNSRIRAKTSVPGSYYGASLQSHMNAELLKTDEAPMVRRVLGMGRDGTFGQAWRRLDQLILQIEDPSSRARVRPRWADPETRVEAQATDSFQKAVASGLGVRVAAEKYLGWSPELVERAVAEAEAAEDRQAERERSLSPRTSATANLSLLSRTEQPQPVALPGSA